MDYTTEPPYSTQLNVQGTKPLNAEPSAAALVEFNITPEELLYCRNHGPVRVFDEEAYSLTVKGTSKGDINLSLAHLKSHYRLHHVTATLQCAGIRRREMGAIKPVHGVPWADGVVANCKWGGVRLSDLLADLDISEQDNSHVCFESHATSCQDDSCYGASISLNQALKEENDVLLAFEMNDEPLGPHHGGPLRIVVPGFLGARWVKWLDTIIISSEESQNFYQQRDYKILPPTVEDKESAKPLWSKYPCMTSLPLNSVIAYAEFISATDLHIKGYALPGASGNVKEVEITLDDGKTWNPTNILYQGGKWGWTLWETQVKCAEETGKVHSRATDMSGYVQPREGVWNLRGVAYNGWGVDVGVLPRHTIYIFTFCLCPHFQNTNMVLGRLVHYTFDAVLVSTVLAGVKRSTGFGPDAEKITEPTVRSVVETFLGVGDTVFNMVQGTAVNSSYFKKTT